MDSYFVVALILWALFAGRVLWSERKKGMLKYYDDYSDIFPALALSLLSVLILTVFPYMCAGAIGLNSGLVTGRNVTVERIPVLCVDQNAQAYDLKGDYVTTLEHKGLYFAEPNKPIVVIKTTYHGPGADLTDVRWEFVKAEETKK